MVADVRILRIYVPLFAYEGKTRERHRRSRESRRPTATPRSCRCRASALLCSSAMSSTSSAPRAARPGAEPAAGGLESEECEQLEQLALSGAGLRVRRPCEPST